MSASERFGERIRGQVLREQRERRIRSLRAAEAIRSGEIQVPFRCDHCRAPSVHLEDDDKGKTILRCFQCGRATTIEAAHTARKQEMAMIIAAGIDPRPNRRGS